MRIAVVGNGPSAEQYRAFVNSSDRVIRCNAFAPGRCDIWASHFDSEVTNKARAVGVEFAAPVALWLAISPAADRAVRPDEDLRHNALTLADGRPVRQISDEEWIELSAELGERRPSTGFVAVRMALDLCPRELILAGFDATDMDKPGWGSPCWDWNAEPHRVTAHNFAAEKNVLQRLADTGQFCGFKWRTKVNWLRLEA